MKSYFCVEENYGSVTLSSVSDAVTVYIKIKLLGDIGNSWVWLVWVSHWHHLIEGEGYIGGFDF